MSSTNGNSNKEIHPHSDIEQRGFHEIHALQIGTDINTYGAWQQSIAEGNAVNFYDWQASQNSVNSDKAN